MSTVWTEWTCSCNIRYADEVKICLTRLLLGTNPGASLPTEINACSNAMETSQFTFNQTARSLRLSQQLGRLCLLCFGILREYYQPIFRSMIKMWILHRAVKFSWSFGMQFIVNIQANWQEDYCFIMTMPDPIEPQATQERIQGPQLGLPEYLPYSLDLAPSDYPLFGLLKKPPLWQTFHWWRRGWNRGAQVTETTVKRLLCCGFRRNGKVMGQVYQCWWRICREINVFFFRLEYYMFYVLYPFVTYLLSLPRIWEVREVGNILVIWNIWFPSFWIDSIWRRTPQISLQNIFSSKAPR
jgi:hypothetical protein